MEPNTQLRQWLSVEAASGVVLLAATAAALIWANSPWSASYENLWHYTPEFAWLPGAGQSLHFWINEALMAFFFLAVGLEIRKELHDGALCNARLAALPLAAAAGGVVLPALIYVVVNPEPPLLGGWAVPTATDIAFAVGVLAVLGKRVPPPLRILLLALAIIDDIVAILVIAFFYSAGVSIAGLSIAMAGLLLVLVLKRFKIDSAPLYLIPGALIWLGFLKAGIHPTLAGVVLGLLAPVVRAQRLAVMLHPWVAFGIMPLFALANAGVSFAGLQLNTPDAAALTVGIAGALVVGKPLGIFLASFLAAKLGLASLPAGVSWRGVILVGCLGGIGFTMSIFIAGLAFPDSNHLSTAKFAVLMGSALAALIGLSFGRWSRLS